MIFDDFSEISFQLHETMFLSTLDSFLTTLSLRFEMANLAWWLPWGCKHQAFLPTKYTSRSSELYVERKGLERIQARQRERERCKSSTQRISMS